MLATAHQGGLTERLPSALANAVFDASGGRLPRATLTPERLKQAVA
jgi:CO/xanthine dehydrogenase Mo-binding subunit